MNYSYLEKRQGNLNDDLNVPAVALAAFIGQMASSIIGEKAESPPDM